MSTEDKTTTWYKVIGMQISSVQVVRTTECMVQLPGNPRLYAKRSSHDSYYETLEQAEAAVLKYLHEELSKAHNRAELAAKDIAKFEELIRDRVGN